MSWQEAFGTGLLCVAVGLTWAFYLRAVHRLHQEQTRLLDQSKSQLEETSALAQETKEKIDQALRLERKRHEDLTRTVEDLQAQLEEERDDDDDADSWKRP